MNVIESEDIHTIAQNRQDCTTSDLNRTRGKYYCLITNNPESIASKIIESDNIDELYTTGFIEDKERILRKFKLWCTMDKNHHYLESTKKIAELAAVPKLEVEVEGEVVESKFATKKIVREFNHADDKIEYFWNLAEEHLMEGWNDDDDQVLFLKLFNKNTLIPLPRHFQNSAFGGKREQVGEFILKVASVLDDDLRKSSLDNAAEQIGGMLLTVPEFIYRFRYPADLADLPDGIMDVADGWLWMTPNQYESSIFYFNNEHPSCIDIGPAVLFNTFGVEYKKSIDCHCAWNKHKKSCPDINNYGQMVPKFKLKYPYGLGIMRRPWNPLEDNISLYMDPSNTKLEVAIGPSQDSLFFNKGKCNHRVLFKITFNGVKPAHIEYNQDVPCELFRAIIIAIRAHPSSILMVRRNLFTFYSKNDD